MRGKDSVKKQQYVCFALGLTKCFPEKYNHFAGESITTLFDAFLE